MVRFLFLLLIFSIGAIHTGMAQEDKVDNDPDELEIIVEEEESVKNVNDVKPQRLKPHLEVGTSFTYSPNNFYGPSYYIAPGLTYMVTPRFAVSAGVAVERSNYYFMNSYVPDNDGMLPMTRAFLYARGTYFLTPRLAISGTAYKTINDVPKLKDASYPYNYGYNYQGMSIGLDYKISNSFSFGIHISTQSGNYNPNSLIPPSGYVYVPGF